MADIRKVTLVSEDKVKKEFAIDHASRILKSELKSKRKTWTLPSDSPYTLDNGHLIKRSGAQVDKGAQASEGNTESEGQKDEA
jgi:hypothetical protein